MHESFREFGTKLRNSKFCGNTNFESKSNSHDIKLRYALLQQQNSIADLGPQTKTQPDSKNKLLLKHHSYIRVTFGCKWFGHLNVVNKVMVTRSVNIVISFVV